MNKVEELVEWVAREKLFKDDLHPTSRIEWERKWDRLTELGRHYWLEKAKQILSHPDLALINNRQEYDKVLIGVLVSLQDRLDIDKDLAEIKAIGYTVGILESIIPLAEALKED